MYIKKLRVLNYRNIEKLNIEFDKNINIIYGNNAQGKTNILEAIYLFSYGKSFRTKRDSDLVKFGNDYFFAELEFFKNDRENKIIISYDNIKNKKLIKINGINQKRLSDVIGKLNVVIFKPDDIYLIKGSPSNRRHFIDILISSIKPMYLEYLNTYNKVLEERNTILKNFKIKKNDNQEMIKQNKKLLEIYSDKLFDLNLKIYEYRKKYVECLNKYIIDIHKKISNTKNIVEEINLEYKSKLEYKEEFKKTFDMNLEKDIKKGYTEYGVHRDDIIITLNSLDVSKYGSQGQQKSSALSLKLAELMVIRDEIGFMPVLLLDDFISELDNTRVKNIISNFEDIQIIITTTDLSQINEKNGKIYKIDKGKIIE